MSGARLPWRCLVVGDRVVERVGRAGWRPLRPPGADRRAPSTVAACAALPDGDGDRIARLEPTSRAAALAAHFAIAGAASALGRRTEDVSVFLWVTMPDGCAAADRLFWETARDAGGGLASPKGFVATLPSAVAGDVALALGLRGPVIVTAGSAAPPGGVPDAALDAAEGAADVLVCLTVVPARPGARSTRVLAVALPPAPRVAPDRPRATLRGMRAPFGPLRGGCVLGG